MAGAIRPLFVLGTRPEVIKLAPVIRECHRRGDAIHPIVLATGQHQELMRLAQEELEIRVDCELRPLRVNPSLSVQVAKCLQGVDEVIANVQPDFVVAQGDTASVAAAAMAAFFRQVRFVHVEAGLRTGDMLAPWPEEWNRRVVSLAASIHCAPTPQAADNLRSEGIPTVQIHVTGNTIVDALNWTLARKAANDRGSTFLDALAPRDRVVVVTAHRRENHGVPLARICHAVASLAQDFPEVRFVFPVHLNPHVKSVVMRELSGHANVSLLPPLRHLEFVRLLVRACLVLTDSGGVQEEACTLGKPALILRQRTERPEVLQSARLVGTDAENIRQEARKLLADGTSCERPAANPLGDGRAAVRIVDLIAQDGRC